MSWTNLGVPASEGAVNQSSVSTSPGEWRFSYYTVSTGEQVGWAFRNLSGYLEHDQAAIDAAYLLDSSPLPIMDDEYLVSEGYDWPCGWSQFSEHYGDEQLCEEEPQPQPSEGSLLFGYSTTTCTYTSDEFATSSYFATESECVTETAQPYEQAIPDIILYGLLVVFWFVVYFSVSKILRPTLR